MPRKAPPSTKEYERKKMMMIAYYHEKKRVLNMNRILTEVVNGKRKGIYQSTLDKYRTPDKSGTIVWSNDEYMYLSTKVLDKVTSKPNLIFNNVPNVVDRNNDIRNDGNVVNDDVSDDDEAAYDNDNDDVADNTEDVTARFANTIQVDTPREVPVQAVEPPTVSMAERSRLEREAAIEAQRLRSSTPNLTNYVTEIDGKRVVSLQEVIEVYLSKRTIYKNDIKAVGDVAKSTIIQNIGNVRQLFSKMFDTPVPNKKKQNGESLAKFDREHFISDVFEEFTPQMVVKRLKEDKKKLQPETISKYINVIMLMIGDGAYPPMMNDIELTVEADSTKTAQEQYKEYQKEMKTRGEAEMLTKQANQKEEPFDMVSVYTQMFMIEKRLRLKFLSKTLSAKDDNDYLVALLYTIGTFEKTIASENIKMCGRSHFGAIKITDSTNGNKILQDKDFKGRLYFKDTGRLFINQYKTGERFKYDYVINPVARKLIAKSIERRPREYLIDYKPYDKKGVEENIIGKLDDTIVTAVHRVFKIKNVAFPANQAGETPKNFGTHLMRKTVETLYQKILLIKDPKNPTQQEETDARVKMSRVMSHTPNTAAITYLQILNKNENQGDLKEYLNRVLASAKNDDKFPSNGLLTKSPSPPKQKAKAPPKQKAKAPPKQKAKAPPKQKAKPASKTVVQDNPTEPGRKSSRKRKPNSKY